MKRIIVHVSDTAVGTEGVPDGVEVEVRLYGDAVLERTPHADLERDEDGEWYLRHVFRGGLDSLSGKDD